MDIQIRRIGSPEHTADFLKSQPHDPATVMAQARKALEYLIQYGLTSYLQPAYDSVSLTIDPQLEITAVYRSGDAVFVQGAVPRYSYEKFEYTFHS